MAEFNNLYAHGFVRVAAVSPRVHLADPAGNARETIELMRKADKAGAALAVFPELGMSGYTLDDLHVHRLRELWRHIYVQLTPGGVGPWLYREKP